MSIKLIFHTLKFLRFRQIFWQIFYRIVPAKFRIVPAPKSRSRGKFRVAWIEKIPCNDGENFTFLNIRDAFKSWDFGGNGALWAFNLNYMDWLCQPKISVPAGTRWIDDFIEAFPRNSLALSPYPTALRIINWAKFIDKNAAEIPSKKRAIWEDFLYSQTLWLERRRERHLLGNHFLEDLFALFIAANYFADNALLRRAGTQLLAELREQILPDGAHFEQSAMYHCILLDRLLDCVNICGNDEFAGTLREFAQKMLGHLENCVNADGTFPLFNDAAEKIAPFPQAIFDYARRLGISWQKIPFKECGWRKLENAQFSLVADCGNFAAAYQPGHAHADSLAYELRIGGVPAVVDTGISTYEKNARRLFERGTSAHNCVVIGGKNSSEIWSGFRVGNRANVKILHESPTEIRATHDGFGVPVERIFCLREREIEISETVPAGTLAETHIHLSPENSVIERSQNCVKTALANFQFENAERVELRPCEVNREYNSPQKTQEIVAIFRGKMSYKIQI